MLMSWLYFIGIIVFYSILLILIDNSTGTLIFHYIALATSIFGLMFGDRFENWLIKKINIWKKKDHESGIPMAEWEERQRQKALDEKLTNGKYTKAEKEHLIYTANLSTDKKDTLREKHLGQKKKPPVTHL